MGGRSGAGADNVAEGLSGAEFVEVGSAAEVADDLGGGASGGGVGGQFVVGAVGGVDRDVEHGGTGLEGELAPVEEGGRGKRLRADRVGDCTDGLVGGQVAVHDGLDFARREEAGNAGLNFVPGDGGSAVEGVIGQVVEFALQGAQSGGRKEVRFGLFEAPEFAHHTFAERGEAGGGDRYRVKLGGEVLGEAGRGITETADGESQPFEVGVEGVGDACDGGIVGGGFEGVLEANLMRT